MYNQNILNDLAPHLRLDISGPNVLVHDDKEKKSYPFESLEQAQKFIVEKIEVDKL